jgi:hypothetical protein
MMSTAKELLLARIDKTLSREAAAIAGSLWGMLEVNAPPELFALFGAVVVALLQATKAANAFAQYRSTAATVAAVVADTQDKPTDAPELDTQTQPADQPFPNNDEAPSDD